MQIFPATPALDNGGEDQESGRKSPSGATECGSFRDPALSLGGGAQEGRRKGPTGAKGIAHFSATQRWRALEAELKKAAGKVQQAQQIADLAVTQRNDMETELKKAKEQPSQSEETGRTAQKSADLVANQSKPGQTPSIVTSAESTPADPQAEESSNASGDEQSLKKFVLDYLQTVGSDEVSTQGNFFLRKESHIMTKD